MASTDSPGVRPVTWVTLGLLVLSWVLLISELLRGGLTLPALRPEAAGLILLALGAHVIAAAAAWTGRRRPFLRLTVLVAALVYLAFSATDFLMVFWPREAARLGLDDGERLLPWVCTAWGIGWVAGILAITWSVWGTRRPLPSHGE